MGFNILFSVLTCCITCFRGRCRRACHVCVIYDHCLWELGLLITRQWRCRDNWNVMGCDVLLGGDPYWIRLPNVLNLERNGKGFGQSLSFFVVFKGYFSQLSTDLDLWRETWLKPFSVTQQIFSMPSSVLFLALTN